MAEATQEMIALAREMFAKHKGWGNNAPFWDDLRKGLDSGVFDRESELRIALAAIQATTERAANLAVEWRNECKAGVADGDQSTAAYQVRGAAIMTSEDRKQLSEIGYQVIDAKNEHVEKGWIVRVPNDDERVLIAASEGEAWDAARDHHASMTSEVTLAQCPIGLFWAGDELCLKTEYGNNEGRIDAYIVSTGEFFWGSHPQTIPNQRMQMVRPVPEEALARLTAQSGEGRSGAGEDAGPFHVSQSGDGKKLWFSARDPASGVTIPARDRTDARNLVSSLNHACATFAALNARQSGEGERDGAKVVSELSARDRRTLTDTQRLIWRDDVEGICPTPDMCFEYGDHVRCGPCAIKQAAAHGVASDMSLPSLPEVARLRREASDLSRRVEALAVDLDAHVLVMTNNPDLAIDVGNRVRAALRATDDAGGA